jgi:hypothetical protein
VREARQPLLKKAILPIKGSFSSTAHAVAAEQSTSIPHTFLWTNMPADDILNLAENEGADYNEDLSILFAGKKSTTRFQRADTNFRRTSCQRPFAGYGNGPCATQ